ncbi:FAD-dependent oxidoreductase [Photobacterium sp. ZSDE20]|uniref:FAD-dependent oxidoreductase n=1 Tax=Photobacterium pectinilyticum TaxID=2906793 RepID=A0ABT1N3B8_9GAMM|nr:NAD(P)-binding protein [Photobacterium sp. ZSDE20]MCQ1059241.1 FAD-dependent oxidoreductase [Photobacterium sp. ZSDE20]MDD1824526.1 FAD-dependent oxidoreductase [Photobacterium sp. ZSDE20]
MKEQANPHIHRTSFSVGIIGGGIAGSTIALRLAELGVNVEIFEEGTSLVNGPPICHLHAGGNLYREISDEQCTALLQQSIDSLKVFPHTVNIRPTVIAVPKHDNGDPNALLPRLSKLKQVYSQLVKEDPTNRVIGNPDQYFKLYDKEDLQALSSQPMPAQPIRFDDWMIPVAKNLELDQFKYPLVLVQEYGWSVFRLAATANLALDKLNTSQVHTQSKVTHVEQQADQSWLIEYQQYDNSQQDHITRRSQVDYLVNACGFQTGEIDDMAKQKRNRLVEFKAAYVTQWPDSQGFWPEVIFHGERGTPDGMAQLTPYPDGYFQLHGMTEEITLFKQGLAKSTPSSAQPKLANTFIRKIKSGWDKSEIDIRSSRAIKHMSRFVPNYKTASVGGKPLFGAQQIPGDDITLRAADVSFAGQRYARAEIVKASSALSAANSIVEKLQSEELLRSPSNEVVIEQCFPVTRSLSAIDVERYAIQLAHERDYPEALAKTFSFELSD